MSNRSVARAAALASCLLVFAARAAIAAPLDFVGEMSITIQVASDTLVFPLQGGGVANVNPGSAGPHLTAISLPAGALTVQGFVAPVTDPAAAPIHGVQMTAANAAGVLAESGGRLQGPLPLAGVAKVCLFGPCSAAVANLAIPLSVVGRPANAIVTAAVNLTVQGAPWTTGTAMLGNAIVQGGAHGPGDMTSTTAQLGGELNAVTPIFISSNMSGTPDPRLPIWPAIAQLAVRFGGASLLECGNGVDDDGDGLVDFPDDPGCTKATDFSERQAGHVCDDGIDNDADGLFDFPADPGCVNPTDPSEATDCQNGIDDDHDGTTDFPADLGCTSGTDASERETGLVCDDAVDNDSDGAADFPDDAGCTGPTDTSETGDCQNGVDDDGDGLVDFPADTGCVGATDGSEREPSRICDDGSDNDGDGAADFPADPGCSSAVDETESSLLACDDGLDNDGDGVADFPSDAGCVSALDDSERGPAHACDNGADDDADGVADYPDDSGCASPTGDSELGQCQDGLDNDGDGLVDFPVDPDCTSASDASETPLPACSDGVDNDGDGFVDYPADPDCASPTDASETSLVRWEVAQGGNGHYYEVVTPPLSWTNARPAAGQRRPPTGYGPGHLASFSSAAEEAFVDSALGNAEGWIGFTDEVVEGEWRWIDATPGIWQDPDNFANPIQTAYVDWAPGEPNNATEDYALFGWSGIRWNDGGDYPALVRPYYVEYEPAGPACDNGVDDDGDGLADLADPGCTSATDDSEHEASLVCDDGADNDGDLRTDYPADPGCASPTDDSERSPTLVCDDGADNDADGVADFPADPGCTSPSGASETGDCQNGVDDDADGATDFPDDTGCTSAVDTSEREASRICDDGLDNDGDGDGDFPADLGCSSATDETESSQLACDDGLDNDGDGLADFPADPGCTSIFDDSERGAAFACDDGDDNDGDGVADFPDDPGCTGPTDASEVGQCQNGNDDDGDGLVDFPADPDCSAITDPIEAPRPECSNEEDDDGDGATDWPADAQCTGPDDASETAAVRWEAADGGNNHYYELVVETRTWASARSAAGQRTPPTGYGPGHLASFSSAAEDLFVWSNLHPSSVTGGWIGFTDEVVEGEWRWIDDATGVWQDPDVFPSPIQTVPYQNWAGGGGPGAEPNDQAPGEDYALFGWYIDQWNDGRAENLAFYVEYEPAGPACDNTVDDDGDGLADLADPGCADAADTSERSPSLVCDDGADNDGDGRIDVPSDPGCASPTDDSEQNAAAPCDDGLDNDGDDLIDLADLGCADLVDASEQSAELACDNGIDDDGDGLVDLADPGCPFSYASPENPQCDDGLDNDGNGLVDVDDPKCAPWWPYWETTPPPEAFSCGVGAELALVLMGLRWLRGRPRR